MIDKEEVRDNLIKNLNLSYPLPLFKLLKLAYEDMKLSTSVISQLSGVSITTITKLLKLNRIKLRPRGGPNFKGKNP